MRILLTGFEPFGGEQINPSWKSVTRLTQNTIADREIVARQIPTVFGAAIESVIQAIQQVKPQAVISLGQAGGRAGFSVERIGINLNDARIPDNEGNQPIDQLISPEGPVAYFSTLPVREIVENLQKGKIPASISNSAGTYVCNHLLYGTLHYIAKEQLPIIAGFIHIPYLPEQAVAHRDQPSMALETIVLGLEQVVNVVGDHVS